MKRIIFHVDVNNAFLSWTAVYLLNHGYPKDIRTIPSIIGGDEEARKGVVLAKSPVAKKYGIVTAETLYSARKKCPMVKTFPANYAWYKEESKKLPIHSRKDIDINGKDILEAVNKQSGPWLKTLLRDIEIAIINRDVQNIKPEIIRWVKSHVEIQ